MDILVERLFPDQRKLLIPGFLIRSTAPTNVEDENPPEIDEDRPVLQDIVERLYQNSKAGGDLGIVIAIHGYNSGSVDAKRDYVQEGWYQPLCMYANEDSAIQKKRGDLLFLGYRWPSESVSDLGIRKEALKALPIVLSVLAFGGLIAAIAALVLLFITHAIGITLLAVVGALCAAVVFSLYLLRVSVYFRDSYRASQFGVPDLVELIRELDQGLVQQKIQDTLTDDVLYEKIFSKVPAAKEVSRDQLLRLLKVIDQELEKKPDLEIDLNDAKFQWFLRKLKHILLPIEIEESLLVDLIQRWILLQGMENDAALYYWRKHPIQLSFIGHSMGGYVTTQVIRILSDIFDSRSIGSIGNDQSKKNPSSRVGRVFRLGRLVLVAPDIPVLAITSGRSNFLRSALRRFEEAYLFSNEGDLALRLASTAANYFSFPARTRAQGYRLGNVTISPKEEIKTKSKQNRQSYGILNRTEMVDPSSHLLSYLELNVLNKDNIQKLDPVSQKQAGEEGVATEVVDQEAIADLFTFFDCTEYCDRTDYNPHAQLANANVLILDGQQSPLRLWDYLRLTLGMVTFSARRFPKGGRDVHGGYFSGQFSKLLIYRLAFLGLQGLLDSLILATPEMLGISTPLPQDLAAGLTRVFDWEQTTGMIVVPNNDPTLLSNARLNQLQEKRQIALNYLSWICEQKRIQAVFSPERYQVDVLGRDRDDIREELLTRTAQRHSPTESPSQ